MRLIIEPKDSLLHEDVKIVAEDLEPNANYLFVMKMLHHVGTFYAKGVYNSGATGVIDLHVNQPIRGSYSGSNPQALFQVQQRTDNVRPGQYCTTSPPEPYIYELEIRDAVGEVVWTEKDIIKRWKHPAVTRTEIEVDEIRGTLFKPPGDGPFPSIIDISGTGGGLNEHKGAALASRGFCVFSLAFFQYKDLIKEMKHLDINYFKKAIKWFVSLPFTSDRIGYQGVSFGGLLVHILAANCPEIIAVSSINGSIVLDSVLSLKDGDKKFPCGITDYKKVYYLNGHMCYDKAVKEIKFTSEAEIALENTAKDCAFRYTCALDDLSTPTVFVTNYYRERLKKLGRYVEVDMASGGHLMDPPCFPIHCTVYSKLIDSMQAYGGEPSLHGYSQYLVWERTIKFFKKFLGEPPEMPDYRQDMKANSSTSSKI